MVGFLHSSLFAGHLLLPEGVNGVAFEARLVFKRRLPKVNLILGFAL